MEKSLLKCILPVEEKNIGQEILTKQAKRQTKKESVRDTSDSVLQKVIVLSGPTGVGKTRLSLALAEKLHGEIVSADSMQVYRGMDIGTAKATVEERQRVIHHMIDIKDVSEICNVKEFFDKSQKALKDIASRGKVAIVVGGTGFYIHSLIYGPPSGPPSNSLVRAELDQKEQKLGIEFLYNTLCSFDPLYAHSITMSDRHKILRALEIIEISGKKVSDFSWKSRKPLAQYDFRLWFLHMPRKLLYERVETRCDEMLQQGLLQEVVRLDQAHIRSNPTASQAIGYRQTLDFLNSAKTKEEYSTFVAQFKMASRHLVKRQLTWFRKESLFKWRDISSMSEQAFIDEVVQNYAM